MTRHRNLFALANLCHLGPNEVGELRIGDFAQLLAGIRQAEAAAAKANEGR